MDQYEDLLITAAGDYHAADDALDRMRHDGTPRQKVRAAENTTHQLRAVVEALILYTSGSPLHLHQPLPTAEQVAEDFAEQGRRRHRTTPAWDGIVHVPADLRPWAKGATCGATPDGRFLLPCTLPAGHEGFHEDTAGDTWPRTSTPKPADDQDDAAARELADQIRHNHATPDAAEVLANQIPCVSQFEATTHRTEPNTIHCRLKAGHDGKHEGRGHEAGALRRWDDDTTGPSMWPSGVGRTVQEALHAAKPTGTIFDDGRPLPCGAPGKFSPDTCTLYMGHAGNHEDASGCDWQQETCDEPYPGDAKGRACNRWKGHRGDHHTREGWAWE